MWPTFDSQHVRVRGLPLGVLGYTLVLASVVLGDVGETQEAAEHLLGGARLGQLAVLPQPRHLRGRTAGGRGKKKQETKVGNDVEAIERETEDVRLCRGGKNA